MTNRMSMLFSIFQQMRPDELLITWLNWTNRFIPPRPRQVLQSAEFLANPLLGQRNDDLHALITDIREGMDLTKYLSRLVRYGYVSPTNRRKDLDLMLNAWGVHHLHFAQDLEADGFVKRDGPIVFAIFRPDKAYLIDILTHDDWARERVIRTLVQNWPDDGLVFELPGANGLAYTISDEERKTYRNMHINTAIEVDGKAYWPGSGMMSSGVSIETANCARQIISEYKRFAELYERDPQGIKEREPDFQASFVSGGYGVLEKKSETFLRLGPSKASL